MNHELSPLGEKIFLDRYALKDMTRDSLAVGQIVIAKFQQGKLEAREVATVTSIDKTGVTIETRDGDVKTVPVEHLDIPIETNVEQMFARVAKGAAAVEQTEEKKLEWENKFNWLLDGFKFTPGGRILAALGTEQNLSLYNCFSGETVVTTSKGKFPIRELKGEHEVLSYGEKFRKAFFSSYGVQELMEVTLEDDQVFFATPNHEWVVFDENTYSISLYCEDRVKTKDLEGYEIPTNTSPREYVRVVSVKPTNRVEEVYCCSEPETHTMTIGNGILTGQCFVIPSPKDSRQGVMDCLSNMAEIMSRGGGVGINISSLRPRYAYVKGVNGRSSGSVSWGGLYSFVTGLIEQGGCLPYSALMSTDKGLIRAGDLADRLEAGEVIKAQTHQGLQPFTAVFRNGVKECVKLVTERGIECIVSKDHKMAVLREGKMELEPAGSLQPGDQVLSLLGEGSDGQYIQLPDTQGSTDSGAKYVKLPGVLDERLAYLIGYYQANGSRCSREGEGRGLVIAVPENRPGVKEQLLKISREIFNEEFRVYKGDGKVERLTNTSVNLYRWWHENKFTKTSETANVPEVIFQSSSSVQAAFFAGWFDADGCDRGAKGGYGIDSISRDAVNGLQNLLAHNGILSKLSWTVRPQENWQDIARLSVTGALFKNRLSDWMFPWSIKDKRVPTKRTEIVYPSAVISDLNIRRKYYNKVWPGLPSPYISYNALTEIQKNLVAAELHEQAAKVEEILRTVPDSVRSVEVLGSEEVVDFEVKGTHMLCSNGLYSSNSRRGALLMLLADWHPDVLEYINSKREAGKITNANISVGISDKFMQAVEDDADWELVFPDTNSPNYTENWDGNLNKWIESGGPIVVHKTMKAREIWNEIITSAWASAEPGLFFIDRANSMSNSYYYDRGDLICTNPCGEQPLPAWSVCNLGHINLAQFVTDVPHVGLEIWWEQLRQAVRYATRFLDNVIDATPYFSEGNKTQQLGERRVGLGTIGLAEMLIRLEVAYGSEESLEIIDKIYQVIAEEAYLTSAEIAAEKGAFPWCNNDLLCGSKFIQSLPVHVQNAAEEHGLRNVTLLTQAPTGTVGTMIGTSTGIEPFYFWSYFRKGRLGVHEEKVNVYREWQEANPDLDPETQKPAYFVNAMDLAPEGHVKVQAAIQRWVDSAISKTCNVPSTYTVEETRKLYELMHKLGCKGGTIYRDKSRDEQVLNLDKPEEIKINSEAPVADSKPLQKEAGPKLRPRPYKRFGATVSKQTPGGTAHVTMNDDEDGNPFEVFVDIGKGGSDIKAMAEGLGRLCSLILRLGSGLTAQEKIEEIINQLSGIGGQRSIGFGSNRVKSLPDALAQALEEHYGGEVFEANDGVLGDYFEEKKIAADLCPGCGDVSLMQIEGCSSCPGCGHSEC